MVFDAEPPPAVVDLLLLLWPEFVLPEADVELLLLSEWRVELLPNEALDDFELLLMFDDCWWVACCRHFARRFLNQT